MKIISYKINLKPFVQETKLAKGDTYEGIPLKRGMTVKTPMLVGEIIIAGELSETEADFIRIGDVVMYTGMNYVITYKMDNEVTLTQMCLTMPRFDFSSSGELYVTQRLALEYEPINLTSEETPKYDNK